MGNAWRLERTYLTGAGFPESRLEGLDLTWSDPFERTQHSAIWAENGTGKTTITALRFALYLPHSWDFIRGDSDRSLAKLVRSGDVCHVVEQATRLVGDEPQRIVMGMVAHWTDDGVQDLDHPRKLQREYYGWLTHGPGPTISNLPFRNRQGRRTTHNQFANAVRALLPEGGVLPPHRPSEHHEAWLKWLSAADIDLDQSRFQAKMNESEGGVDQKMRFADSDAFVQWLLGATTPTRTVERISESIDVLRVHAAARPRWLNELRLWEQVGEQLARLADGHDRVLEQQGALKEAKSRGAAMVADAEATLAVLTRNESRADAERAEHGRNVKTAISVARRAGAHQVRMRVRGAELRSENAAAIAKKQRAERDKAASSLAAWELVVTVREARAARAHLAGLNEQLATLQKEAAELQGDERQHRHDLARVLTDLREQATAELNKARRQHKRAVSEAEMATASLHEALAQRAKATEQVHQAEERESASQQVIAKATTSGLLPEGASPAALDTSWAEHITATRRERRAADETLRSIDERITQEQAHAARANRRAIAVRADADNARQRLVQTDDRVLRLTEDERLRDAVGDTIIELWAARPALTESLRQRAEAADRDAGRARAEAAAARRTLDSVGSDGLLPSSPLVEELVRLCVDSDVPAWTGWGWLASTLLPQAAAAFTKARPEIASGIVLARPDHLEKALAAVSSRPLDTAVWIGAVSDPEAAVTRDAAAQGDGTHGRVLLPHPGTYDRDAAGEMVHTATRAKEEAELERRAAIQRAGEARDALATLTHLWKEMPTDPRPDFTTRIRISAEQLAAAEADERDAQGELRELAQNKEQRQRQRDAAQAVIEEISEQRRLLVPVIDAAAALADTRERLPALLDVASRATGRIDTLDHQLPRLQLSADEAGELVKAMKRRRDDASEALRSAHLSSTVDGPVPTEDPETIRARLTATVAALQRAVIDQDLLGNIETARAQVADLDAVLDDAAEYRQQAEEYAGTEAARHPVALAGAVRRAKATEAQARETYARAQHDMQAAHEVLRQLLDERTARTATPDLKGFPSAAEVTTAADADRLAELLGTRVTQSQETQQTEEARLHAAQAAAREAAQANQLVDTTVNSLRYLADSSVAGHPADDVTALVGDINQATNRLRFAQQALADGERSEIEATTAVHALANESRAHDVADAQDPHVVDLITRLRSDAHLPADARHLAGQLEQRAASLRDDLDRHDQNVHDCARILHIQVSKALTRLRSYQNQSRLPEGLGDWSNRHFVLISHDKPPENEQVAIDRITRVIHSLLVPGSRSSSGPDSLLFAATRALFDNPFQVRILKPHTDLRLDRVNVADLKNFSAGQRVTAGVLLYAAMTKVRSMNETSAIGWLWLDNPFGQASADQFVRTMRRAADEMDVQLLFTAAPMDKGALSMFDRTIALNRRSRPATGEKIVVIDDGEREVVDLTVIQRDVMKVLGS
ncbi:hypothetical protein ACFU99_08895 [Streptomyces sp. NPDC057654]|uniref:hypothetical protein n=1 Tax=Streptomyces sp. NPDC057654 TaxID=3346196 RepID=UPI0036928AA9